MLQPATTSMKPGDFVVCIDDEGYNGDPDKQWVCKGQIYLIKHREKGLYDPLHLEGVEKTWRYTRFRFATPEEIIRYRAGNRSISSSNTEPECKCPILGLHDTSCSYLSWKREQDKNKEWAAWR